VVPGGIAMFEWLLIGIELAFLYFGFWFVFIRKPDVYRIKGDPWGSYEDMNSFAVRHARESDTTPMKMPYTR
jgi:hypothetical protein